ncbi:MAG: methyltransferase domain-containing protein [Acidobacteria bacterium]|nr:methyltransferase domain-containing protein [Acidobacteriota bacterium]
MAPAPPSGLPSFGDWDSSAYARYRPTYPNSLFDMLAEECPRRRVAWDCAAGSGQATQALVQRFERVVATDVNAAQLGAGSFGGGIPITSDAVAAPLRSHSVDLVIVAQALHWFAGPAFFAEVERVATGGKFAAWTYGLFSVHESVDPIIENLYANIVGPYWPAERRHIEANYSTIQFLLPKHRQEQLSMSVEWTASDAVAYLTTWSAVRRYRDATKQDPVAQIEATLRDAWGTGSRTVAWPLSVHLCDVP